MVGICRRRLDDDGSVLWGVFGEEFFELQKKGGGLVDEAIEGSGVVHKLEAGLAGGDDEKADGLNRNATAATAAEGELVRGFGVEFAAAGGKAAAELGNGDDDGAVFGLNSIADDGIDLDDFFDIFHGFFHELIDRMIFHVYNLLDVDGSGDR